MVESNAGGGSFRCGCQEEYNPEESEDTSCCSPQVFTSVMLGVLSCVLMTGGVFLAFHRWDPLWLIVSGIGVALIFIGSILHCCNSRESRNRRKTSSGKGCCGRSVVHPDHLHNHLTANNGSLTEQLLPLSNARSVSQLSLNMLPGYFPPVVTTYGIEQHSAVVQNINRIVQQQQSQSSGSASPGVASGAGKSFILLSLPGDATQANIQNLVATVYQMGGSGLVETPATDASSPTTPCNPPTTAMPVPLILKNAEVQTCSVWHKTVIMPTTIPEHEVLQQSALVDNASGPNSSNLAELDRPSTSTSCVVTQTEAENPPICVNLMDCSSEMPPICDNHQQATVTTAGPNALTNIPATSVLVDISDVLTVPESTFPPSNVNTVPIPENSTFLNLDLSSPNLDSSGSNQVESSIVLETSDSTATNSNGTPLSEFTSIDIIPQNSTENVISSTEVVVNCPETENAVQVENSSSQLSLNCSNLSELDGDVEDSELLERSSPPPSYDDVAQEGDSAAAAAFGSAYGTI